MITMTLDEFKASVLAQGVKIEDAAFVCPMCGKVQSACDLINAGVGEDFEEVEKFLAYSCVGRWTNAGPPKKEKNGQGCNWTLGGLFRCHELEVVTPDGEKHPRFIPATPEQAKWHAMEVQS